MIHSLLSKISKDSPLTSQPEKNLHQNVARWSAEAIMEVSGYRMVGGVVWCVKVVKTPGGEFMVKCARRS